MKKYYFVFMVLLFVISCTTNDSENKSGKSQNVTFSVKNFVGSTVAYKEKGEIKLGVSNGELLQSFNSYSTKMEMGIIAKDFGIEEIDDNNYIRFYNEDKSVSTIALMERNSLGNSPVKVYTLGQTVCTTTACANCCGCVPRGAYCLECDVNPSDCKRTTSNVIENP